ncbi:sigma-54-dependent Fis family transcriptional regulator [Candidatus Sumerlaeota bacterium]|nr:sigma-54-dependent Fis family transcriptional regulator [Candidatus Sumerlaeota bacterium]
MKRRLLIVEDHPESLMGLTRFFERQGFEVVAAPTFAEGERSLAEGGYDLVLTDLKLPDGSGAKIVEQAQGLHPRPPVIMLTAHGTIETAVEVMRQGAYDFLTKPLNLGELKVQVERALEHSALVEENVQLRTQLDTKFGFDGIIGETKAITDILGKVRQVAPTRAPVLILGESGTGKELLARAIHQNSPRVRRPFIPVHCAALAETLLESELFGHERGAFTGAHERHRGRFETAEGGTLFLDEVGEIPLAMQVKLLRVLESHEIQRVGGNETIPVDFRLVAATNRELAEEVEEGRFREDLYYRLNVVSFTLPPLRQRQADIPALVDALLREFAQEHGRSVPRISSEAMARLIAHPWPGNVRELRNAIENAVIFLEDDEIGVANLPATMGEGAADRPAGSLFAPGMTLDQMEQEAIRQTLTLTSGNRTRAAEMLGISRRTLQRKIKELGIDGG